MSEITRQEVIDFMDNLLNGMKTNYPESNAVQTYKKAIEYIRQVPKYRKKAKRWKKKYLALKAKRTPCDLCRFNPPSSGDGNPCTMCPAVKGEGEE